MRALPRIWTVANILVGRSWFSRPKSRARRGLRQAGRSSFEFVSCQVPSYFPSRDLDPGNPLGLKSPSTEIPLFLIDLNVLFERS